MLRPQPIGIFPLPANLLLLPEAPGVRPALEALLQGAMPNARSAAWPAEWLFFERALAGDTESALAALPPGPLAAYNRLVLTGDATGIPDIEDPTLARLTEAVLFSLGATESLPSTTGLDGELFAAVSLVRAAAFLEQDDLPAAANELTAAIEASQTVSPLLAAQLLGERAKVRQILGDAHYPLAAADYGEALRLAAGCPLPGFLAELHLAAGNLHHAMSQGRRGPLEVAVQHYQQAVHAGFTLEDAPEQYAWAQHHIGLAYLASPSRTSSDQLRMGIAVQSLREALKVYTRESHPELYASVRMNLANALQYLPSSHPEENLQQAVEIYEELLQIRQRALDPVAYARTLFNQANALAHLGIFAPALEKLAEAHKLFHWHGEPDLAAEALAQSAAIQSQREAAMALPATQ